MEQAPRNTGEASPTRAVWDGEASLFTRCHGTESCRTRFPVFGERVNTARERRGLYNKPCRTRFPVFGERVLVHARQH